MEAKRQSDGPLTSNKALLASVTNILNEKAHLMILWVSLQIDAIWESGGASDDEIRKILDDLPKDLDETYRRCVGRLKGLLASRVLFYVYATLTPFHVEQLREILAIDENTGRIDRGRVPDFKMIMKSCAGLVSYSQTNDVIIPAHHSAVLFLERNEGRLDLLEGNFNLTASRLSLGTLCVRHLTGPDYALQISSANTQTVSLDLNPYRMLETLHLTKIPGLFKPRETRLVQLRSPMRSKTHTAGLPPAFYYARDNWALLTHHIDFKSSSYTLFKELALGKGQSWGLHPWKPSGQSRDSHYQGLLGWAIAETHQPMLHVLIHGSDSQPREEIFKLPLPQYDSKLPLELAVCKKSTEIYRMLLPLCYHPSNRTLQRLLLECAAKVGFVEVLEQCLRDRWDLSPKAMYVDLLFTLALERDQRDFLRRLLDSALKPSSSRYFQAIKVACFSGESHNIGTLVACLPNDFQIDFAIELPHFIQEAARMGHDDAVLALMAATRSRF
ncbi:hypothetical protein N0V90_004096 [Kalmusia sp. IMI 367209]|nr:hypothetical protein N0V90_004096 [Kalmusia sp. IMI 367209]